VTVDYWTLTRDFTQGDTVHRINFTNGGLSPYVGTVTAVHNGLGVIDVQWPFGNERVFPDELVLVAPEFIRFLPPTLDQSLKTVDVMKARKQASESKLWRHRELPAQTYVELARLWHKGASEVIAYDDLYRAFSAQVKDESLRDEVGKFYLFAQNAQDMRIQSHIAKSAAYWIAQNRQYRATSEDIKLGKPACPKCATRMRGTTYKMHEGSKHKLFACPKCLYLIDPPSVLGPAGQPHAWFGASL